MTREKNLKWNFKKGSKNKKDYFTQNDFLKKSQEKRKGRKEKTERKEEDVSPICWKNQHLSGYIKARE